MNCNVLLTSGRTFHKFISNITENLSRPRAKFITDLICGIIFSGNLILTRIASKIPQPARLTLATMVM